MELEISCFNEKEELIRLAAGYSCLKLVPRKGESIIDEDGDEWVVKKVIHYTTAYSHEISIICKKA